ncbi:hypothetical protein VNI00_007475 [Paramarasmius palmivorus]|uniref:Uncharacterized protein n=1 Tax=Paramarasmius palmivorus TaxID=297713 RepID=A0AAW0D688_9AGAR
MSSPRHEPTTQNKNVRRVAFSNWPTIKIFNPPIGRYSTKTDEWCLTYCTQNVAGRFHGRTPDCRSICIRKVFPHEVRNLVSFKRHKELGADGKAKYPLPPEGQPTNIPRLLGGKPPVDTTEDEDDDDDFPSSMPSKPAPPEVKYWDEGWYLWSTSSYFGSLRKLSMMKHDLEGEQRVLSQRKMAEAQWMEYQQFLERHASLRDSDLLDRPPEGEDSKWYGLKVPPRPLPDHIDESLLLPIPLDTPPIWQRINKLLEPTRRALSITRESIASGETKDFALRVWGKAWTDEPWTLASKTCQRAYEMWKKSSDKDDDENKSSS